MLHGTDAAALVQRRGRHRALAVKAERHTATVFVNGIGQSWIPYGGIHTVLGALPAFVHPAAADRGGDRARVGRHRLRGRRAPGADAHHLHRDHPAAVRHAAGLGAAQRHPGLDALLTDPRIEHVAGDGRAYVMRTAGVRHHRGGRVAAGQRLFGKPVFVGLLHAAAIAARARRAGGDVGADGALHDTFAAVFPHVLSFGDILLGSDVADPLRPREVARASARIPLCSTICRAGIDIEALLAPYLAAPSPAHRRRSAHTDRSERDLFPRDEFSVPRTKVP